MEIIDLTLPAGSAPAEDAWAGNARNVNCFAAPLERGKSEFVISATDGLAPLSTIEGGGGVRAMSPVTDSEGLVISGRLAHRTDTTGTTTLVGSVPSDGHCAIAQNTDGEVAVVSDGLVFGYTGGVFSQVSDADLPPPIDVCSIGGYFVFALADGRMYASDLNDYAVDGLSYAENEVVPDKGVSCWVRGNDLLAGGTRSIQAWQVTGAEGFPFSPVQTIVDPDTQQTIGVLSAGSCRDGLFCASDRTIKLISGYSCQTISPPALNRLIALDRSPSAITVTRWSSHGFTHYAFSGTAWTWVYNATTKQWHELESYGLARWRCSHVMELGGALIAGHYDTGKLFSLDHDTHTEDGDPHVMDTYSVSIGRFPKRLSHHTLDLDIAPGTVGLTETDRSVELAWSDNGEPFAHEMLRTLGGYAQTNNKIRFHQLGSSFNRTYRLRMSAGGRRAIYGGKLAVSGMGNG